MMERIIAVFSTIFGGLAVIIGMIVLVWSIAHLTDRVSWWRSGALTAQEYEERQNASQLTLEAGLAGLLMDERSQIYRAFFDKRSFPYYKAAASEEEEKGTNDLEAQTPDETTIDTMEESVSDKLSIDDDVHVPSCSICLNEYNDGDKVILGTVCSHMFHFDCSMQWVDKGNEHCPYCRENMITADDFRVTAIEVLGEPRVNKIQRINEEAAARVAALTASGARTIQDVVPPVGQAPVATLQNDGTLELTAIVTTSMKEPEEAPVITYQTEPLTVVVPTPSPAAAERATARIDESTQYVDTNPSPSVVIHPIDANENKRRR